jgi:hypothetical protein
MHPTFKGCLQTGGILAVFFATLSLTGGCQSSFYYHCHDGAEIDAGKKSAITATSLEFMRAVLSGDMDAAYNRFSDAAKTNTPRDQFQAILQGFKPAGPFHSLQVERIMTVTGWGDNSKSNGIAICSKDAAHPEDGTTLAIQKSQEQAYVLVSAKGQGPPETWVAAVWLIPKAEKWEVHSFHATIGTILGQGPEHYLTMARAEKERGHLLNAGMLYTDAASIAARGPFYRTNIEDVIEREAQQITQPGELRGQAPLKGPTGSFNLVRFQTAPLKEKLYLLVAYETDQWKTPHEIEGKNMLLIKTFAQRFPEYSNVFAGLVAEATVRGGTNGWRTVKDNAAISVALKATAGHK